MLTEAYLLDGYPRTINQAIMLDQMINVPIVIWLNISDEKYSEEKITSVTKIYNQLGVRTICEDKMLEFYTKAVANLEKVSVSDIKKQELRNLASKLMSRND